MEKPKRKTFPNDPWSTSAILKFNTAKDSEPLFEVPKNCSVAAAEFFKVMTKGVALFIHLVKLSTFSDNAAFVAHQLINEGEALPKNYDPFVLLNPSSGHFTHQTRKLADDLLEMLTVRLCDNFTTYMSEIIRDALSTKPEALRSKENITIEMALSFDTIEELRESIIDRKVNELAYLGFQRLAEWMSDRLGIEGIEKMPSYIAITHMIEIRNCIVHNRSRVSKKYVQLSNSASGFKADEKFPIDSDELLIFASATYESVIFLDNIISAKFPVPKIPH